MKSKSVRLSVRTSQELNVKGPTFNYASIGAGIAASGNGRRSRRALPHGQVAGCDKNL